MKTTDWMVEFFAKKGVKVMFGYPGGVICHFMDSITKRKCEIQAKLTYHEQAASFAACAYGQATHNAGVAFATSGPGATNLITGIANAYFDSVPVVYITGQVDTYSLKGNLEITQKGFQETDIVQMVRPITKYTVRITDKSDVCYEMEKAWAIANSGRRGPVLIDVPADIQRTEIEPRLLRHFPDIEGTFDVKKYKNLIENMLLQAKRPVILAGAAIKQLGLKKDFESFVINNKIPVVSSMNAVDILPRDCSLYMGFIGTNGHRSANFAIQKSDLVLSMGSRLDLKQVGNNRSLFAKNAKLIRVDIDDGELSYKVKEDEIAIKTDLKPLIQAINEINLEVQWSNWIEVCNKLKEDLIEYDYNEEAHYILDKISMVTAPETDYTLDVGHNEIWSAQSIRLKKNQEIYLSGGLGSMGYSLPAAIGLCYAKNSIVISINGDGGFQMNIQELQFIRRENLPIKVIVLNNKSLGMIRQFQESNFNKNYYLTTNETGYSAPPLKKIAEAYELGYVCISNSSDVEGIKDMIIDSNPYIIEVILNCETYLTPKYGKSQLLSDQEPLLERKKFEYYNKM